MSNADGSASAGDGTAKRSKHDRQAERSAESGVVGVKIAAGKKGKSGGEGAEAKPPASVAVAAPMFAAQLALGMGGSSGWD